MTSLKTRIPGCVQSLYACALSCALLKILPGMIALFFSFIMAQISGTSRLKHDNYEHSTLFKSFILSFVSSLGRDDREAFRFWCINVIPRAKLDVAVVDEGDVLRLIEFLLDDNKLSFTDMSFLERFLSSRKRYDLLEDLKFAEVCIAVDVILEAYGMVRSSEVESTTGDRGSIVDRKAVWVDVDIASVNGFGFKYVDIVDFLVSTREKNQVQISQVVEQLKCVSIGDMEVLELLDNVIKDCQQWSTVTASMAVLGELYSTFVSEKKGYLEVFARWMLKNGGLVSIR